MNLWENHPRLVKSAATILLFGVSAWISALTIFIFFGFNPGRSAAKDSSWIIGLAAWAVAMPGLLVVGLIRAFRPGRDRTWGATLMAMATAPVWLPTGVTLVTSL